MLDACCRVTASLVQVILQEIWIAVGDGGACAQGDAEAQLEGLPTVVRLAGPLCFANAARLKEHLLELVVSAPLIWLAEPAQGVGWLHPNIHCPACPKPYTCPLQYLPLQFVGKLNMLDVAKARGA